MKVNIMQMFYFCTLFMHLCIKLKHLNEGAVLTLKSSRHRIEEHTQFVSVVVSSSLFQYIGNLSMIFA